MTKEIQLTQDLMSLFVEYQIPSDLLTYDGPENVLAREKVDAVKGNVKAVLDVIETSRIKELEEAKQKRLMNKRGQDNSDDSDDSSDSYGEEEAEAESESETEFDLLRRMFIVQSECSAVPRAPGIVAGSSPRFVCKIR